MPRGSDIDELRSVLDADKSMYAESHGRSTHKPSHKTPRAGPPASSVGMSTAERSVVRLGSAIQAAEEEMEAALRRTTEVHRSNLAAKEEELQELQHQVASKERAVDGLKEALATTKRTYEGKMGQLEEALGAKTAQVAVLSKQVKAAAAERQAASTHLTRAAALHEQEVADLRALNAELTGALRQKAEEAARAQASLAAERADMSRASQEIAELRRQLEMLQDRLLVERVEGRGKEEQLAIQIEELRRRLKAERGLRKTCEKWMRSELRSREEMECLLGVVRDAAVGHGTAASRLLALEQGLAVQSDDDRDVRRLLRRLGSETSPAKQQELLRSGLSPRPHSSRRPAHSITTTEVLRSPRHSTAGELAALHRKAVEDNERLRAELAASKRLNERLRAY